MCTCACFPLSDSLPWLSRVHLSSGADSIVEVHKKGTSEVVARITRKQLTCSEVCGKTNRFQVDFQTVCPPDMSEVQKHTYTLSCVCESTCLRVVELVCPLDVTGAKSNTHTDLPYVTVGCVCESINMSDCRSGGRHQLDCLFSTLSVCLSVSLWSGYD